MTKTITNAKALSPEKARESRQLAGANHPAVKRFSAIVRDAVLLRSRIYEWTKENDTGDDSPGLLALAAATESDLPPAVWNVNDILRQLFFIDCTLETATEAITSGLYSRVMPECFPES